VKRDAEWEQIKKGLTAVGQDHAAAEVRRKVVKGRRENHSFKTVDARRGG